MKSAITVRGFWLLLFSRKKQVIGYPEQLLFWLWITLWVGDH